MIVQKRKPGCGDRHAQRENEVKTQGECHLQAKDCLRLPEARREEWNGFSLSALARSQPR